MKTRAALTLITFLITAHTGFSQGYSGGFGFFEPGYSSIDLSAFNTLLSLNEYSELSGESFNAGGSGFLMVNNFIIGGRGGGGGLQNVGKTGTSGRFATGYGVFNLGYAFKVSYRSFAYPTVGFGGMQTTLQLENETTTGSVAEALAAPNQVLNLSSSSAILDFSVNFITRVTGGGDATSAGGAFLGISVGAFFSPSNATFKLNDRVMTDVPDFTPSGFFIRLKLGGGGFGKPE
jgi:hypothetical protein